MNVVNGVVEQTGTKEVDTRNGKKDTYSFKVGGTWYKAGFKNPGVSKGQVVSFDYTVGKWGNDVDVASIVIGGSATPPVASSGPDSQKAKEFKNGPFPIDPLDGQRSILRQNAVTNARELFCYYNKELPTGIDALESILALAKRIESYTSGDADMEAAKASVGE